MHFYTGDLPPGEIAFIQTQQLREKKSKGSSLSRRLTMSHVQTSQSPTKQNLYQKKRKLLKIIEKTKVDYEKGKYLFDKFQAFFMEIFILYRIMLPTLT